MNKAYERLRLKYDDSETEKNNYAMIIFTLILTSITYKSLYQILMAITFILSFAFGYYLIKNDYFYIKLKMYLNDDRTSFKKGFVYYLGRLITYITAIALPILTFILLIKKVE